MPALRELRAATDACGSPPEPSADQTLRHDWTRAEIEALFTLPFTELLHRAASVHRRHFDPAEVQVSTLLSVKTGGCPEDCAYCPQAQRYHTGVQATKLMGLEAVLEKARAAKAAGASRFCMGAAWRSPKDRDIPKVAEMVREVKALGLETCATLGMLSNAQAQALKQAGLDYYNHNLDTAPEFYGEIIHTREYQDRLDTLAHVRDAGMKTCCGGIVGMGESRAQRAGLLQALANLPAHPDSVPINRLVQVEGTPLDGTAELDPFEFVRTIAVAHRDAALDGAPVGGARIDERRAAGTVLRRRRQFDLLRREAAHHQQPGRGTRPGAVRAAGPAADGRGGRRIGARQARDRACADRRGRRARRYRLKFPPSSSRLSPG
jgi:biotin synthase